MPLPGDPNRITVTGTFEDGEGNPLSGSLTFTPSADLVDPVGAVIVRAEAVTARVVAGSMTPQALLCTDNSSIAPSGWTWSVSEFLGGESSNLPTRTYSVFLPHASGSTVDLASLSPVLPQPAASAVISTATPCTGPPPST